MKYTMQRNDEQKEVFNFGTEEGEQGGGGTSNYNELTNRPSINGNLLTGNKTSQQLGIVDLTQLQVAASAQELEAGQTAEASVSLVNKLMTFLFKIPKGQKGDKGDKGDTGATGATGATGPAGANGTTPDIGISATADNQSGVPSVDVTKSGSDESPNFLFAFHNLKGQTGENGTNGTDGVTPNITMTATVDNNTGTPSVDVTKSGTDAEPTFNLSFHNLKGEGGSGGSSDITATASVGSTTGTPSVQVSKSQTGNVTNFDFAFQNLKGEQGQQGKAGTNGTDGVTPEIAVTATVDANTGTPSVEVTKTGTAENPSFALAFHNLKGEQGQSGGGGTETVILPWKTVSSDDGSTTSINFDNYTQDEFVFLAYSAYSGTWRAFYRYVITKEELRQMIAQASTNMFSIALPAVGESWTSYNKYRTLFILRFQQTSAGTDVGTFTISQKFFFGDSTNNNNLKLCVLAK